MRREELRDQVAAALASLPLGHGSGYYEGAEALADAILAAVPALSVPDGLAEALDALDDLRGWVMVQPWVGWSDKAKHIAVALDALWDCLTAESGQNEALAILPSNPGSTAMTADMLAAIRERDRQATRCATCGTTLGGHRDDTLATCERHIRRQAKAEGKGADYLAERRRRNGGTLCGEPSAHHPFVPSDERDDWNGDADRRTLLALLDAEAARHREAGLDVETLAQAIARIGVIANGTWVNFEREDAETIAAEYARLRAAEARQEKP